jgi:hypothetical protein
MANGNWNVVCGPCTRGVSNKFDATCVNPHIVFCFLLLMPIFLHVVFSFLVFRLWPIHCAEAAVTR